MPRTDGDATMEQGRQQQIRERAYFIWEREGCPEDRAEEHWRIAEEELRADEKGAEPHPVSPVFADIDRTEAGEPPAADTGLP
jgi:hypothetical protein